MHDQADEPAQTENADCEQEFISGEEDYMDSDFEGREGYRKGGFQPCWYHNQSLVTTVWCVADVALYIISLRF
jgi:hypothetical protein